MIYITLPNFYFNYNIYNVLKQMQLNSPQMLKTDITFSVAEGNFPYCYWNGGYTVNCGEGTFYNEIENFMQNVVFPIRLNCNNIYLEEDDYDNTLANLILTKGEAGSNIISVANLDLYKFLKEKYPHYRYTFSKEADLINPMTPEIINGLVNHGDFSIIELPERYSNNWDLLNQIQKPEFTEISITSICNLNCPNYTQCKYKTHALEYDFSGRNIYFDCIKNKYGYNPIITFEQIINEYIPKHFNHFYLAPAINVSIETYISFIVEYFFKSEYQIKVFKELMEVTKID